MAKFFCHGSVPPARSTVLPSNPGPRRGPPANGAAGHAASRAIPHMRGRSAGRRCRLRTEPPCARAAAGQTAGTRTTHSPPAGHAGRASREPVTSHTKVSDTSSVRGSGDRTWAKRRCGRWTRNATRSERWRRLIPGSNPRSGCPDQQAPSTQGQPNQEPKGRVSAPVAICCWNMRGMPGDDVWLISVAE